MEKILEIFLDYLEPYLLSSDIDHQAGLQDHRLCRHIHFFNPSEGSTDLKLYRIALIGVPEDRNSQNTGCSKAPDLIRGKLLRLFCPANMPSVIDLGNLKPGRSISDSYAALREIIHALLENNIIPLILGGTRELTYAVFMAFASLKKPVNITSVDSAIGIGDNSNGNMQDSYISRIVLEKSRYLFNISVIGYQNYLVSSEETDLMAKLYFDAYRLGTLRRDIFSIEPVLRDTDLLSFNISSVRQSDAPGNSDPSPNGLYAEEACQIARFAGLGNRCSVFGLFGVNPDYDRQDQTTSLAAQIAWHFIEGIANRPDDTPLISSDHFSKYHVRFEEINQEITFYKSNKTGNWWLEIIYGIGDNQKKMLVSCSYEDYEKTCNGELPDRLWKTYQKLG
ncbi:MAG: formimidoylglutamase [Bacteroidia bacterium]|nr:formimidoylglutamase [Bacteroidia bacterium]